MLTMLPKSGQFLCVVSDLSVLFPFSLTRIHRETVFQAPFLADSGPVWRIGFRWPPQADLFGTSRQA